MSLMLRKTCQVVLDDFGYTNLHAAINSSSKMLVLKTPCGKPFAVVHGVVFARLQPTNTEVEYAAELLAEWMTRNADKLEAYVDAKAFLEKNSASEKLLRFNWEKEGFEVKRSYKGGYYDPSEQTIESITFARLDGELNARWVFNPNMKLLAFRWTGELPPPPWGKQMTLTAAERKSILAYRNKVQQYMDAYNTEQQMHKELNSCED